MIVRDVLLIGPWHHHDDRSATYRRTPNDYEAEHILLRTIRCVSGEVQTIVDCEPVLDYGRSPVRWEYTGNGYHQGRASAPGSDVELTLTTDMLLGFEGGQASSRTLLKAGDTRFVALSWGGAEPPTNYEEAYRRLVWTAHHWQHWLARGQFPDHPWRSYLQRSALTLKGLTYSPTGAVTAAGGRPRSRRHRAATATTTTGSPGSATRPSPCGGCTPWASTGRPSTSSPSSPTSPRARTTCRSCTASAASATSSRRSSTTSPGTPSPGRCGSATRRTPRSSTTSGAPCSTPSTCTPRPPTTSTTGSGRSSTSRWARRSSTGASPTPASGRSAASTGTSPPPRSCAGWPSTAAPGWPG